MPFSWPFHIGTTANMIHWLRPKSVLDVGPGDGMWGVILRRYLDRWYGRYDRKDWTARIDCIEIHEAYIGELHRCVYSNIYVGDVADKPPEFFAPYDLVFMGDVLEHFEKDRGRDLLARIGAEHIVVSLPHGCRIERRDYNGNEHESHLGSWTASDFYALPDWNVRGLNATAGLTTVLLQRRAG